MLVEVDLPLAISGQGFSIIVVFASIRTLDIPLTASAKRTSENVPYGFRNTMLRCDAILTFSVIHHTELFLAVGASPLSK